jgi:NTE family protein
VTADPIGLARLLPAPTAYVLGGGGSYGAVQLGMLRALAATDLSPDLVIGTSVGSVNGAVLAADPTRAAGTLTRIWSQIDRKQVLPGNVVTSMIAARGGRSYLFDPGPLTELLSTYLPVRTIEELALPFVAVATDLDTGARVDLESGDLRSALLASSAVPAVFPWVERDGRRLVDGGLVANIPVRQAVERGARSVVVLDCGQFGGTGRWAVGLVGVIVQSLAIATRQQVITDLVVAREVPVVYLPAPAAITSSIFDFAHTGPLSDHAYAEALQMLAGLARRDEPLAPGLYGRPPVGIDNPAVAALRRP